MDDFIQPDEILSLIAEVGEPLQLCVRSKTRASDVEYGIPAQQSMNCRPVRGYVVPDRFAEMQLAGQGETRSGALIAYISGTDLNLEELTGESYLTYNNQAYDLEHLQAVKQRGAVLMHKLRMARSRITTKHPGPIP